MTDDELREAGEFWIPMIWIGIHVMMYIVVRIGELV